MLGRPKIFYLKSNFLGLTKYLLNITLLFGLLITNSTSLSPIFQIINPTPVANTSENAGPGVNIKNKLLYGHSTLAFDSLKHLHTGSKVYIELSGTGNYYLVKKTQVFEKSTLSPYMSALINGWYLGKKYDYVLMTCGNGQNDDETYRYVLFLTKV